MNPSSEWSHSLVSSHCFFRVVVLLEFMSSCRAMGMMFLPSYLCWLLSLRWTIDRILRNLMTQHTGTETTTVQRWLSVFSCWLIHTCRNIAKNIFVSDVKSCPLSKSRARVQLTLSPQFAYILSAYKFVYSFIFAFSSESARERENCSHISSSPTPCFTSWGLEYIAVSGTQSIHIIISPCCPCSPSCLWSGSRYGRCLIFNNFVPWHWALSLK
jgi:hypothetical protein